MPGTGLSTLCVLICPQCFEGGTVAPGLREGRCLARRCPASEGQCCDQDPSLLPLSPGLLPLHHCSWGGGGLEKERGGRRVKARGSCAA